MNYMNRCLAVYTITMTLALFWMFTVSAGEYTAPEEEVIRVETSIIIEETTEEPTTVYISKDFQETYEPKISEDEIELLALVTVAEAEGESEYGKRLVIDTILNRVDHDRYPDTIKGVIYQKGQFTSMSNGRAEKCKVTDEVRQLVREELESRTNSEILFFTAGGYGRYGTPLFQVGNHYFCK